MVRLELVDLFVFLLDSFRNRRKRNRVETPASPALDAQEIIEDTDYDTRAKSNPSILPPTSPLQSSTLEARRLQTLVLVDFALDFLPVHFSDSPDSAVALHFPSLVGTVLRALHALPCTPSLACALHFATKMIDRLPLGARSLPQPDVGHFLQHTQLLAPESADVTSLQLETAELTLRLFLVLLQVPCDPRKDSFPMKLSARLSTNTSPKSRLFAFPPIRMWRALAFGRGWPCCKLFPFFHAKQPAKLQCGCGCCLVPSMCTRIIKSRNFSVSFMLWPRSVWKSCCT
jgi:hypothetical protein